MNKTDAAKLGKAVEIARKAGVDDPARRLEVLL